MVKRTTHRSSSGKKLYAVRDSKGRFKDIQTYEQAHSQDMKRKSKNETKSKSKNETKSKSKNETKSKKKSETKSKKKK